MRKLLLALLCCVCLGLLFACKGVEDVDSVAGSAPGAPESSAPETSLPDEEIEEAEYIGILPDGSLTVAGWEWFDYTPGMNEEQRRWTMPQVFYEDEDVLWAVHVIGHTFWYGQVVLEDFADIRNADITLLVQTAALHTPPIRYGFEYEQGDEGWVRLKPADGGDALLLWQAYEEEDARGTGFSLSDAFYAKDIERTLEYTYGPWPVEGESYSDHFTTGELYSYHENGGFFIQHGDGAFIGGIPQVFNVERTENGLICDAVMVPMFYSGILQITLERPQITPENFAEETTELPAWRWTLEYTPDGYLVVTGLQAL